MSHFWSSRYSSGFIVAVACIFVRREPPPPPPNSSQNPDMATPRAVREFQLLLSRIHRSGWEHLIIIRVRKTPGHEVLRTRRSAIVADDELLKSFIGSESVPNELMSSSEMVCACLFVWLVGCLIVCLLACLFVCLVGCLACLSVCLFVRSVCLFGLFVCLFDCLFVLMFILFVYLVCLFVCLFGLFLCSVCLFDLFVCLVCALVCGLVCHSS